MYLSNIKLIIIIIKSTESEIETNLIKKEQIQIKLKVKDINNKNRKSICKEQKQKLSWLKWGEKGNFDLIFVFWF